ncbi:hypothetical protein N0V85_007345 [Neurospora sp. IMI 360204]|nr:hypothetical protein N0V85_007345 [Neurospora sp. IMI 360204]
MDDDGQVQQKVTLTGSQLVLYEFGKRIRKRLNKAQRDCLLLETVRFIRGCETEQAQRLAGYLPKNGEDYNDIFSFKKELATSSLVNIIPVLYFSGIPWDEVMPTIGDNIEAAAQRIDEATEKLIGMTQDNSELKKAMVQFIDGIKINIAGNIGYS